MKKSFLIKLFSCVFGILIITSCTDKNTPLKENSDTAIFTTKTQTPENYDSCTIFWKMPKIEKGAKLQYTLSLPKHRNFYTHVLTKEIPADEKVRSDFKNEIIPHDSTSNLTFKLMVNKGKIEFLSKPDFYIIFNNRINMTQIPTNKNKGK